ncbi:MAG: peptidoglycan DD-metalloendopeptidase family protein [Tissierellia bacterium]|nr:peptidoglycan DD-metalloendopeptidase family protein [Tissierellia bacterium]
MKRNIALLLVVWLLLGICVTEIGAISQEEYQKKKKQIEEKIKANKSAIQDDKKKMEAEQSQIIMLDAKIRGQDAIIDEYNQEIAQVNGSIEGMIRSIEKTERRIASKEKLLGERIRSMYMSGNAKYISVLLKSKNVHEFLSNRRMYQMLLKQDKELIAFIGKEKQNLEGQKQSLEEEKNHLVTIKEEVEDAKAALEQVRNEKAQYMAKLQQDVKLMEREIEQQQRDARYLDSLVAATDQREGPYTGGRLGWPLPNHHRISSGFGYRLNPFTKRREFHLGIDIPAPMGTPIHAAEGGKVTVAQWMGSYGQIVVVSHGNGVSTAYAHMSKIGCQVGQTVAKGQVIGYIGSTGASTGPHLHFEVRQNGKVTNPVKWVK